MTTIATRLGLAALVTAAIAASPSAASAEAICITTGPSCPRPGVPPRSRSLRERCAQLHRTHYPHGHHYPAPATVTYPVSQRSQPTVVIVNAGRQTQVVVTQSVQHPHVIVTQPRYLHPHPHPHPVYSPLTHPHATVTAPRARRHSGSGGWPTPVRSC